MQSCVSASLSVCRRATRKERQREKMRERKDGYTHDSSRLLTPLSSSRPGSLHLVDSEFLARSFVIRYTLFISLNFQFFFFSLPLFLSPSPSLSILSWSYVSLLLHTSFFLLFLVLSLNMSASAENATNTPFPLAGSKDKDLPPLVSDAPPRVLIAGAGLGGLFLGILLERAGIPYEIFERAAEPRPLGKQSPLRMYCGRRTRKQTHDAFITHPSISFSFLFMP